MTVQTVLANAKVQIACLTGVRTEAVELRLEIKGSVHRDEPEGVW